MFPTISLLISSKLTLLKFSYKILKNFIDIPYYSFKQNNNVKIFPQTKSSPTSCLFTNRNTNPTYQNPLIVKKSQLWPHERDKPDFVSLSS